jgi:hypothetical protein
MTESMRPLTFRLNENGTWRVTFDRQEFERYIRDNRDTSTVIRGDNSNVVGILRTRSIWEEMYSGKSLPLDTCPNQPQDAHLR